MADERVSDWLTSEFRHLDLFDERLYGRFQTTAQKLGRAPQASITEACGSRAETKAAYRLFSNPNLNAKEILDTHCQETAKRCAGERVVLAIQDTSMLDFGSHPACEGMGPIGAGNGKSKGFLIHPTLAMSPSGELLGLIAHQSWVRPPTSNRSRQRASYVARNTPIEKKESYKWLASVQATKEALHCHSHLTVVSVADRESDITEFIAKNKEVGCSFVLRSRTNRRCAYDTTIRQALGNVSWKGEYKLNLASKGGRRAREVTMQIRWKKIEILPTERKNQAVSSTVDYAPQCLTAIEVIEKANTKNPLHWYLLTDRTLTNHVEARETVAWYEKRWHIETFFRTLKSGCRVESCRLGYFDRIERYLAIMLVIAVRITQLSLAARSQPDSPCTKYLHTMEWKVLFHHFNRGKKIPKKPITVRQAVKLLAMLGGHSGYPSAPDPGPTVLWRGWQKVSLVLEMMPEPGALE